LIVKAVNPKNIANTIKPTAFFSWRKQSSEQPSVAKQKPT
jgi:hypothetical protein